MAAIDKFRLRDALLNAETVSLQEAIRLYESHLEGARLDLSEPDDEGRRSQNEQSGTEPQRFEEQSHLHEKHRRTIERIDFRPSVVVELGALVKVNDRYFLIAVPTELLHVDDIEVLGISTEAPLFGAMRGLRSGDSFDFNGNRFLIAEIQ